MISQFSASGDKPTLAEIGITEKDVYPLGRLDTDSEGLLLLTNDRKVNNLLLNPRSQHKRVYLVQVEGLFDKEAANKIENGVLLNFKGKNYKSLPAECEILVEDPNLPERDPPIRFRKNSPTSWIKLKMIEGKNRQVRKMTAKVGYPTLRLIRIAIEDIDLDEMKPGEVQELDKQTFFKKLRMS